MTSGLGGIYHGRRGTLLLEGSKRPLSRSHPRSRIETHTTPFQQLETRLKKTEFPLMDTDKLPGILIVPVILLAAILSTEAGPPQFESIFVEPHLSYPIGIHSDPNGGIFVANTGAHEVLVFNRNGVPLIAVGSFGTGDGQLKAPYDVATEADGDIVIADTFNDRIQIFSPTGVFKNKFGTTGTASGQFHEPYGVAVGRNGFIYVTDRANDRVQVFFPTGLFNFSFGSVGTADGEMNAPTGIAIAPNGDVVVVDQLNDRIQVFDSLGNFKFKFGSPGSGNGQFNVAWGVEIAPGGEILVSDFNGNRVQIFSSSGAFLTRFGSAGTGPGQFDMAAGVAYQSATGRILVTDSDNHRAQIFSAIQPDQWIGRKRGNQRGDNVYNRSGVGQQVRIISERGRRAKFFFTSQNDGAVSDTLELRASNRNRYFRTKILQLTPSRKNVTAAITRTGFTTPVLAPDARPSSKSS